MTQTTPPSPSPPPLRLNELVAACMSAAWLAGEVIREVVADDVDLAMVNKAADKYDPQTVADRRAQQRMTHALRALWPQLQIVGEEGELEAAEPRDAVHADVKSILADVPLRVGDAQLAGELDERELVVWMDPLDGTKKFAEKKYEEVSVLLGIAYKKRPIAGVMHLPFHGGNNGETLWGGPSLGVYKTTHRPGALAGIHVRQERPSPVFPDRALHITTSGTKCPLVDEALAVLKPVRVKYGGATGTMAMSVLTGESDAFFRFRNATKRWDICAIEPLLEALGGRLVDKRGLVYEYDPNDHEAEFDNAHGLIVSMHEATHKLMIETMEEIHVMRTIDGGIMTAQWLEQNVFQGSHVVGRRVKRESILKGKHSIVATVEIDLESLSDSSTLETKHIFLKRYVKEELPPRPARNWARDLASYRSEARFYKSVLPHLKNYPSIRVITPLDVQIRTDADGNETVDGYIVMLENVLAPGSSSKLVAADRLNQGDTERALEFLAGLHASGIKSPALMEQVRKYLWPSATWWAFEKRGLEELKNAPVVWHDVLMAFTDELVSRGIAIDEDVRNLGHRMIRHAAYISGQLFGEPSNEFARLKTLVHGDFKTGNMFFHAETREVTAFDWQWAGVGLGALDVANLLNTSVGIDALSREPQLLRHYYEALERELGDEAHVLERYSFATFQRHYELATLEYARVLIANFWDDTTPESCAADAHKSNWGLGYRSVPHVVRMMEKLLQGLAAVEREQAL